MAAFYLSGSLEEVPLPDIARLFNSTRKTGRVALVSGGSSGGIYFDSGEIIEAQAVNMTGLDALKHLGLFNRGTFEFIDGDAPPARTLATYDTLEMIDILENRMMESRQLQELMPEAAEIPRYQGGAIPPTLEVNAADLAIALRSVVGTESVRHLAAALNLDETTVSYAIARFRAAGLMDMIGRDESLPDGYSAPGVTPAPAPPPLPLPETTATGNLPRYWRGRKIS